MSRRKNSNLLNLNCHLSAHGRFYEEDIKMGFLPLIISAIKTHNIHCGYEFLEHVIVVMKTCTLGGKNPRYLAIDI